MPLLSRHELTDHQLERLEGLLPGKSIGALGAAA